MKMTCISITILAYFLTDILNWKVLWGEGKYLLIICLYEKLKNKISLKNVNSKESVSSKAKNIKGQICSTKFLNSIKL